MISLPSSVPSAVADLAALDWAALDGDEVLAATVALGRLKAVVDGALVEAADRLETTGATDRLGWASVKDFLTHVLGGRKGAGAAFARLAERTRDLPRVRAALVAGDISQAQATAIAGRTTTLPHVEELREQAADRMLVLAREHAYDATDLDRCFPDVVRELDPDGSLLDNDLDLDRQERGAHHARFLSLSPDTLGGVRLKGYGTVEEAELIKAVLMPLTAPTATEPGSCGGEARDAEAGTGPRPCADPGCGHDGRDRRDSGVRMWDALVEACTRLQATDNLPHDHGTTARILVTMPYDALVAGVADGLLPSGDRISAAAVRRLACDAEIIPGVLGADGQVLDVGRAQRLVTTAIWLALVLRDQHCAFPGCRRLPTACDAHHIVHWAEGGPTSLDNLVLLCRRHHTVTHQTPWQLRLDPVTGRPVWIPPPKGTGPSWLYRPPLPPPRLVA